MTACPGKLPFLFVLLAAGTAVVRDMEAGEQTDVALAELAAWLKARI